MTKQPTPPGDPSPARASWPAWWGRAAWLILRGTTWRVALPVALAVGTLLAAVNQGSQLLAGEADAATLLRVAANYAIPYVVSSVGYLGAHAEVTQSPQPRLP